MKKREFILLYNWNKILFGKLKIIIGYSNNYINHKSKRNNKEIEVLKEYLKEWESWPTIILQKAEFFCTELDEKKNSSQNMAKYIELHTLNI